MTRRRLAVVVAYCGQAAPDGWQRQARVGAITAQGLLEHALATAHAGNAVTVHGASRTDAGVHAAMQLAAADVRADITPRQWVQLLNQALPAGIAALWAAWAPVQFHPRHDVGAKTYVYRFCFAPVCHPFVAASCWWRPGRVDLTPLAALAASWQGRHDFAAACSSRADLGAQGTVRTLITSRFVPDDPVCRFICSGRGFLMHQVRILAGTLAHVALGRATAADVTAAMARRDRNGLGPTAPAHGLTLEHVAVPQKAWVDPWPTPVPPGQTPAAPTPL